MSRLYTALDPVHGIFTPDSLLLVPVFLSYIVFRLWRYVDLLVYNIWLFFCQFFYILNLVFLTLNTQISNFHQFLIQYMKLIQIAKMVYILIYPFISSCQLEMHQIMLAKGFLAHVSQNCFFSPCLLRITRLMLARIVFPSPCWPKSLNQAHVS